MSDDTHSSSPPLSPSGQRPYSAPPPQTAAYPPQAYPRQVYHYAPYGTPPQPFRRPTSTWFWPAIIVGSVALLGLLFWAVLWSALRSSESPAFATQHIAVIDIDGVILDADKIDTQLRRFGDDSSVKAIILHINSPGGGAAASQEIFHEVLRVRQEKHKKIIASVESMGASGAYYIASACDRIYANDASVVGSIGVIMEWTNYGDLLRWAKLKSVVIHAGELKDAGDPTHDMTPKEAAYFQSVVDNMYTQFVRDVADGRHTSFAKIQPLATGQVWTGEQSLQLGLIDKIGGFRTALMDTARDAGISGEPSIVRSPQARKGLTAFLSGESDDLFPNPTKLLDRSPGFYFMWK